MMVAPGNLHIRLSALLGLTATLLLTVSSANASSVTFYTSSTDFNSAATGFSTLTYTEAPGITPGVYLQTSPLSSSTVTTNLAPGSIPAGITISNATPALTPGLIFYTAGQIAGSGAVIGTNYFGDPLVLSFNPSVSAVGMDVFAAIDPGQTLAGSFSESVYDGTTLLGSTTFTDAAGQEAFTGVTSTDPITSIQLLYLTDDASTFANDIAFSSSAPSSGGTPPTGGGSTPPSGGGGGTGGSGPTASAVTPEPSTWTLLATGTLLLSARLRKFRRGGL